MRKFRFGGNPHSILAMKSESGVVQSSLKRRTWLLRTQDSVPPSKVQRGRIGIPWDFSVLEVCIAGITEGIYDLSPQNCSWCCLTVTESLVLPPKSGPPASMGINLKFLSQPIPWYSEPKSCQFIKLHPLPRCRSLPKPPSHPRGHPRYVGILVCLRCRSWMLRDRPPGGR